VAGGGTETAEQAKARGELDRLVRLADAAIDPAETALALAVLDYPLRDRNAYRLQLMEHAGELAELAAAKEAATAADRARLLGGLLMGRLRFQLADEFDQTEDPVNLISLLETRRGPPLTLALLWIDAARRQGWRIEPLAFPAALLLRLTDEAGGRVIVEAGGGGEPLAVPHLRDMLKATSGAAAELEPSHYAEQSNRTLLIRLQTMIKLRYLRLGAVRRAIDSAEATLLFAPEQTALWRELGLMYLRQGDLSPAVKALERFVAQSPNSPSRHRTSVLLQELRSRLQ